MRIIGAFVYAGSNPVVVIDPDGNHLEVIKNNGGQYKYTIVGGVPDKDLNVYENYGRKDQKVIGTMLTQYSFMDESSNKALLGTQINLADKSGQNFLNNIEGNTPSLSYYMQNATGWKKYDFKTNGLNRSANRAYAEIYKNRGMKVNVGGRNYIASARDIGNFAAGYVAAKHGMSWTEAKTGFDGLETKQHVIPRWERLVNNPSFSNLISAIKSTHWYTEGNPTRYAEKLGFNIGYKTKEARAIRMSILKSMSYGTQRLQY